MNRIKVELPEGGVVTLEINKKDTAKALRALQVVKSLKQLKHIKNAIQKRNGIK